MREYVHFLLTLRIERNSKMGFKGVGYEVVDVYAARLIRDPEAGCCEISNKLPSAIKIGSFVVT